MKTCPTLGCSMKRVTCLSAILATRLLTSSAEAEVFINPSPTAEDQRIEFGLHLGWSEVRYDIERSEIDAPPETAIERAFIAAYGGVGLTDYLKLFLGVRVGAAEADVIDDVDGGYSIAAGIKGNLWRGDNLSVGYFGQFTYTEEQYGDRLNDTAYFVNLAEYEGTYNELDLGLIIEYAMGPLNIYGGVDWIAWDDGEVDITEHNADRLPSGALKPVVTETYSADLERQDTFGGRIGAELDFDPFWVRAEATFAHEEGLSISTGMAF